MYQSEIIFFFFEKMNFLQRDINVRERNVLGKLYDIKLS